MVNIFSEIEEKILLDETLAFNENKIKEEILQTIARKVDPAMDKEKPFVFEQIIYEFFEYLDINIIKTKKTRDFGIDGIIKLNLELLGEMDLGLQIKYAIIDSNDIDIFLSSLKNSELHFGVIVCKGSRKLEKYELNTKIKAILLSKGINIKERLIKEKISINPIFVLKMDDVIGIIASQIRAIARGIYKK
jgi:hypothetical protein